MITKINVGELRRILSEESKNEFNPVVFGDKESKEINRKAYAETSKRVKDYDGGVLNKKKNGGGIGASDNKGMSDLEYDNISKPFKDKVKSQMKGYTSKDAEDKHKKDEFGNATYDNNGNVYDAAKAHAKASKDGRDTAAKIGLTGSRLNAKDIEDNTELATESKKIKQLTFKNTTFISEGHMLSNVPDEYKKEGNKFVMRDSSDNKYIVEWTSSEPRVTKKPNMRLVNEQKERIKALWGYKSPKANKTTSSFRIQEGNEFVDMVNKARGLIK